MQLFPLYLIETYPTISFPSPEHSPNDNPSAALGNLRPYSFSIGTLKENIVSAFNLMFLQNLLTSLLASQSITGS